MIFARIKSNLDSNEWRDNNRSGTDASINWWHNHTSCCLYEKNSSQRHKYYILKRDKTLCFNLSPMDISLLLFFVILQLIILFQTNKTFIDKHEHNGNHKFKNYWFQHSICWSCLFYCHSTSVQYHVYLTFIFRIINVIIRVLQAEKWNFERG